MSYKNPPVQQIPKLLSDFLKSRCITHHRVVDTRKPGDVARDIMARVEQRLKLTDNCFAVMDKHSNLGNPPASRRASGSFNVDDGKFHGAKVTLMPGIQEILTQIGRGRLDLVQDAV